MKVTKFNIPGVLLLELDVHKDNRGLFLETYQMKRYKDFGINEKFVQDNRSISGKNVLRGFHYQISKPIGQLIYVARGSILDIGVDLRKSSPTFGKHISFELDEKDHRQIYLPPGVAHGFCTFSEVNEIHYKCTEYYYSDDEGGLNWQDKTLNIIWPITNPEIKERDSKFPFLADIPLSDLPD
jgi:dTDP-4-dehydrorhamnose 3,5-epimerase